VLEQAETAAVSVLQLPGVQGLPGPSVYGGGFAPTVDSVAQAAAEGQCKTYASNARQMISSCTHAMKEVGHPAAVLYTT